MRTQANMRSKQEVFSNLPCSDTELQRAWDEMIAFEADGCCVRPGVKDVLSLWRNILNTATAEGFDWSDPTFGTFTLNSLYESLHDYDDTSQVPRELFGALLARLSGNEHGEDHSKDAMDVDCEYNKLKFKIVSNGRSNPNRPKSVCTFRRSTYPRSFCTASRKLYQFFADGCVAKALARGLERGCSIRAP